MSLKVFANAALGAVVIAAGGVFFYAGQHPQGGSVVTVSPQTSTRMPIAASIASTTQRAPSAPSASPAAPAVAAPASSGYTLAAVAAHGNSASCWSAINGKVYDLTSWIGRHPGGAQAILSLCGKDGSSGFNDQHGGQRRPASELAAFYIGQLAQ